MGVPVRGGCVMARQWTRPPKFNRITTPDADAQETVIWYATASFDRACMAMDIKWGVDQLASLVPVEMATKYGRAVAALNDAIAARDVDAVTQNAENCAKGLAAMDRWAEANGMPKSDTAIWQYSIDGFTFGIMAEDHAWQAAKAKRPDLLLFTIREVANALRKYHHDIPPIADTQPKRERTRTEELVDDEIPF